MHGGSLPNPQMDNEKKIVLPASVLNRTHKNDDTCVDALAITAEPLLRCHPLFSGQLP